MAEETTTQDLTIEVNGTEYPFPSFETMTYKEARLIKKITGVVMGQFYEALENGDPDALVAIALVAMGRAGLPFNPDDLDDLPITDIKINTPKEKKDEVAPASPLDGSEPTNEEETGAAPLLSAVESLGS